MVKKVSSRINSNDSPANVLTDVLDTLRFRGSVFFRSGLAAPWGMSLPNLINPRFHVALSGDCYIGMNDASNTVINMAHMDILMLPHGEAHWIADQPGRELTPSEQASDACELNMPLFQHGKITNRLICGLINYEKGVLHPLIDALPMVLHFSGIKQSDPVWMTVLLIDAEMEKAQTNQTSIIDRLTEVLFMQLLNKHMSEHQEVTGFFAALHDKRICRALELLHKNPEHQWTIDLLTEQVNLSRATMTRQFNATVGVPPMTYLLKWRMIKAHHLVKHSSKTIDEISGMVGFSSARTLTKAFLSHHKITPSQLRRQ